MHVEHASNKSGSFLIKLWEVRENYISHIILLQAMVYRYISNAIIISMERPSKNTVSVFYKVAPADVAIK